MELFTGGYFISKSNDHFEGNYIHNNFYTVSNCISDIIPDTWGWDKTLSKKTRVQIRKEYLITDEQIEHIRDDIQILMETNKFELPYVFSSINIARDFYNKYFSHIKNVKILGITLNQKYINEFLNEEGTDNFGVAINLSSHNNIDLSGKFIGYEVLGYEYWGFHTMYCHNELIDYCNNDLNIIFNKYGLINSFDDAEKIVKSIRNYKIGAEPALWQPWGIFEYSVI